jgi:acetyl/propionyl-CoA carboxylase alpha subunit
VRVDSGVTEGDTVSVNYDPLLAKLTAHAESRASTIDRALAALRTFPVLGIRTNIPFLIRILSSPAFRSGNVHTGFVDAHLETLLAANDVPVEALAAAAVAAPPLQAGSAVSAATTDPWTTLADWGRED